MIVFLGATQRPHRDKADFVIIAFSAGSPGRPVQPGDELFQGSSDARSCGGIVGLGALWIGEGGRFRGGEDFADVEESGADGVGDGGEGGGDEVVRGGEGGEGGGVENRVEVEVCACIYGGWDRDIIVIDVCIEEVIDLEKNIVWCYFSGHVLEAT